MVGKALSAVLSVIQYDDEKNENEKNENENENNIPHGISQKLKKSTNIVTAQSFASIFLSDDKIVNNNHMTEFWY